jgi:hypothetical protein
MFSTILAGTTLKRAADPVVQVAAELASTSEADFDVLELKPPLDARKVFHAGGIPRMPTRVMPLAAEEAPDPHRGASSRRACGRLPHKEGVHRTRLPGLYSAP